MAVELPATFGEVSVMPNTERIRESSPTGIALDHLQKKMEAGWTLVAVEWERERQQADAGPIREEVPYGLRVSSDCLFLEENPNEIEALLIMMEGIVQDQPLSRLADDLNRRGFRTRRGEGWTQGDIFRLLPRLVDVGPKLLARKDWPERRRKLFSVA
jgi:hypothetical protein